MLFNQLLVLTRDYKCVNDSDGTIGITICVVIAICFILNYLFSDKKEDRF
jgi:hypothetical protein